MTICSECASRFGYIPKDKVVGIWTAECDFCHEVKPVCDCAHDYWPPMKQRNCDIFNDVRSAKPGNGRSKDGLTRRDCFYAVYAGRGPVACTTPEAEVLTNGMCIGRKLCAMFSTDGERKDGAK